MSTVAGPINAIDPIFQIMGIQPPASKKVRMSTFQLGDDIEMGGVGPLEEKAIQTDATRQSSDKPSLESIRQHISEQFDIEIVLKHREIRLIEQEMAKTQVAIEQLRRCSLIPYTSSPEAQLSYPAGMPEYAPPPGVVDGPYTRHYRQWLLPHPNFDGAAVEPFAPPPPPSVSPFALQQPGRPQRQSAMKVQTKNGEQVCLFRKRDGSLVRLECQTCHRSNFSSAQGFINHCRIAHGTEYASHDAAAEACGKPVDESEQALISPMMRTNLDGPARHTRQTYPPAPPPQLPVRRSSVSKQPPPAYINPYILNPSGPAPTTTTPTPASHGHQRKPSSSASRRASKSIPKTPITPAQRPPTPPMDFSTPHLESLVKRKRMNIDVQEMVKEVTMRDAGGYESSSSVSDGYKSDGGMENDDDLYSRPAKMGAKTKNVRFASGS